MSKNPIVLGVIFLLELAALFAIGYWGWTQHTGILQPLLGIGLPLLAAANQPTAALILGIVVVVEYAVSYDRIRWLLTER